MNTSGNSQVKVAVLPFQNLTPEDKQSFYATGLTEEIIDALSHIKNLRVSSRTTSSSIAQKGEIATEVYNKYHIDILVEGSVRISDEKIRIIANLVDTKNDFQFWSTSMEGPTHEILELESKLSLNIAEQVREMFGHFEIDDSITKQSTKSPSAYSLTAKANQLFNQWNPTDVKLSIDLFEEALHIDPYYADAFVGLADAHGFLAMTQFADPITSWQKVKEYTSKALDLNPKHAGAHYQLANLAFFTEFDFKKAYSYAAKAIEFKPNYPEARQFMSFLYMLRGDFNEANEHLNRAVEIDPFSMETRFYQAYLAYRLNDFERAIELCDVCLSESPHNIPAYTVKAYSLLGNKQYDEAILFSGQQPDEMVVPSDKLGIECMAYALANNEQLFDPVFSTLKEEAQSESAVQAHSYMYLIHAIRNEPDQAFEWVEKGIRYRSPVIMLSFGGPFTSAIRDDKRYTQFYDRIFRISESSVGETASRQLLSEKDAEEVQTRLTALLEDHQEFLDPEISLRSLAGTLQIHPNQLSWLINKKLGVNFNQLINTYRIQHFKEISSDPKYQHLSMIGLAFECGFNSKTAFNTYFKQQTGQTPKQFMNSH